MHLNSQAMGKKLRNRHCLATVTDIPVDIEGAFSIYSMTFVLYAKHQF